jgi:hypothetical protein
MLSWLTGGLLIRGWFDVTFCCNVLMQHFDADAYHVHPYSSPTHSPSLEKSLGQMHYIESRASNKYLPTILLDRSLTVATS